METLDVVVAGHGDLTHVQFERVPFGEGRSWEMGRWKAGGCQKVYRENDPDNGVKVPWFSGGSLFTEDKEQGYYCHMQLVIVLN